MAASAESYICAIGEVFECEPVTGCKETTTAAVNLSNFIVLDTDKKTLTGAALNKAAESEDVEGMEITENTSSCTGIRTKRPGTRRSRSRMEC